MQIQQCGSHINLKTALRLCCVVIVLMTGAFTFAGEKAFAENAKEYTLKAAFTLNFARYARWPDDAFSADDAPCLLCVAGDPGIATAFRRVSGEKIGDRTLKIRFIKTRQDLPPCRMIFIDQTVKLSDVLQFLKAVEGKPVLTISETEEFIRQGGMINFFSQGDHLYFEINMEAVRRQNVKLSSRLLKLAVLTGKE